MPTTATKPLTVALVGNPNTGKSTLFNALTGLRQHTGNYPGVTVELKKGTARLGELSLDLIDLPGTYSLAPRSPDEMVSVDLLLGRRPEEPRPDVVLSILDATNLDRHLYLTTQLMELGVPVVAAVNLIDVAAKQGVKIDFAALEKRLGISVVPVQANRGKGLEELKRALVRAAEVGTAPVGPEFPEAFRTEAEALRTELGPETSPFLAGRLLLDVGGYAESRLGADRPGLADKVTSARARLSEAGAGVPGVEARARYGWIRQALAGVVTRPASPPPTFADTVDRVLTHKVSGTLVFLAMMFGVFVSIFVGAQPLMDLIDGGRGDLADLVTDNMGPGPLRSLLADGVIKGVGAVLVFLPQILILFAFIAVLEDCGYMARAAFLMDRIMARCGLNGKSFIPLLSSTACAIPGVMATRVIENRRDRLATILVAPLMSCSARLPLYILMTYAFLYDREKDPVWLPAVYVFAMYLVGLVVAPLVALALKRTLLRGETPAFVMELPAFKVPQLRTVLRRMADAGWAFVRRAGTLILASMVLVWAALYFPNGGQYDEKLEPVRAEIKKAEEANDEETKKAAEDARNKLTEEWKAQSYLGRAGKALEPAFAPLGWDWKIGMAAIASFPAREVVVGTMGIIYGQGEDSAEEAEENPENSALVSAVREDWEKDPVRGPYRVPVALGLMVFFALCCQCASTLAVIRRETKSWAWPAFTFAYMTALAYLGALVVFQVGKLVVGAVT